MPNYDYACKTCEQTITVNRGINDPENKPKCLKCMAVMIRVYDSPVVNFNSPGFYSTEGKI
jgi:putative FmdB family regulatory protein